MSGTISNIPQFNALETVYKKVVGYANAYQGSTIGSEIKETSARPKIISNKQLFTDSIPDSPPSVPSSGINITVGGLTAIKKISTTHPYIVKYENVPLEGRNFGFSYRCAPNTLKNGGLYDNLLENAIPSDYGIGIAQGRGYNVEVRDSNNNLISQSDATYPWIFDSDAGILSILGSTPLGPEINGTTYTQNPRISFWRYEGTIGLDNIASTGTFDVSGTNTTLKPQYTSVQAPKIQAGTSNFVDPSNSSTVLDVYGNANFGQPYMKPALYYKPPKVDNIDYTIQSVAVSNSGKHIAILAVSRPITGPYTSSNNKAIVYVFINGSITPSITQSLGQNVLDILYPNYTHRDTVPLTDYISNIVIDDTGNTYFAIQYYNNNIPTKVRIDFYKIAYIPYGSGAFGSGLYTTYIDTSINGLNYNIHPSTRIRLAISLSNSYIIIAYKSSSIFNTNGTFDNYINIHTYTINNSDYQNFNLVQFDFKSKIVPNATSSNYRERGLLVSPIYNNDKNNMFLITGTEGFNYPQLDTYTINYNAQTNSFSNFFLRPAFNVYYDNFFAFDISNGIVLRASGGSREFNNTTDLGGNDYSGLRGDSVFAISKIKYNYAVADMNGQILYSNNNLLSLFQIGPSAKWRGIDISIDHSVFVAINASELYAFNIKSTQKIAFQSPGTQVFIGDKPNNTPQSSAALTVDGGLVVKNENSIVAGFGNRIQVRGLDANIDVSGSQGSIKLLSNENIGNEDGSALILTNNKNNNWGSQISINKRITGGTAADNLLGLVGFQGTRTNNELGRAGYIATYQDGAASTSAVPGKMSFVINNGIEEKTYLQINKSGNFITDTQGVNFYNRRGIPLLTMDTGGRVSSNNSIPRTYVTNFDTTNANIYKKIVVSATGKYQAAITDTELYLSDDFGETWLSSTKKYRSSQSTSDFIGFTILDIAISNTESSLPRIALICKDNINLVNANVQLMNVNIKYTLVKTKTRFLSRAIIDRNTSIDKTFNLQLGIQRIVENIQLHISNDFGNVWSNKSNIDYSIPITVNNNDNTTSSINISRNNISITSNISGTNQTFKTQEFNIIEVTQDLYRYREEIEYTINGYNNTNSQYSYLAPNVIQLYIHSQSIFFDENNNINFSIGYRYVTIGNLLKNDTFISSTGLSIFFNIGLRIHSYIVFTGQNNISYNYQYMQKNTSRVIEIRYNNTTTVENLGIENFSGNYNNKINTSNLPISNISYRYIHNYTYNFNNGCILWRDMTTNNLIVQPYNINNTTGLSERRIQVDTTLLTNIYNNIALSDIFINGYQTIYMSDRGILYRLDYNPITTLYTSISLSSNISYITRLFNTGKNIYIIRGNRLIEIDIVTNTETELFSPNFPISNGLLINWCAADDSRNLFMYSVSADNNTNPRIFKYTIPHFCLAYTSQCLGVGTNNPQAKLDVIGDIKATSITNGTISRSVTDIINATPTGSILMWSTTIAPSGWLICDGSAVSRLTYNVLFNVIGTTFGPGDNLNTFNLPNMKQRFPVGYDVTDTSYNAIGKIGGSREHTLTIDEIPSHNHAIGVNGGSGTGALWTNTNSAYQGGYNTTATGGGKPHENRPPFFTINYIIKT